MLNIKWRYDDMTLYEFLNNKTNTVKITAQTFNVVSMLKAFNTVQFNNDKVKNIFMSPEKFNELKHKAETDIFEQNNVYQKIIEEKRVFNTPIIIDEKMDDNIIRATGEKVTVEMFIEQL